MILDADQAVEIESSLSRKAPQVWEKYLPMPRFLRSPTTGNCVVPPRDEVIEATI
jgi:hypothetical protein